MKTRVLGAIGVMVAMVGGCAESLPPPELVQARTTYVQVAGGPAAQYKPDDLLSAKQQLDRAETLFIDKGDAPETKDAAYVAIRKAQYADAAAKTVMAEKERLAADQGAVNAQANALTQTRGALASTQGQLDQERIARAEAERKAELAFADLAKLAMVKKEDRGMVITLPGGVLFKTDKYEIVGGAMPQLNKVSEALLHISPDSTVVVEGHTDSQGDAAHNMELSLHRAQSVVDFLVAHGVAPDRIKAVGVGADRPIADNKSVEGRAQNRRVEIIVHNPK